MKTLYPLLIATFLLSAVRINCYAQSPYWAWAKDNTGSGTDQVNAIATDVSGNVYMLGTYTNAFGYFADTALFASGGNTFLVKCNANGHVLWAKNINGNSNIQSTFIAIDSIGNAYTVINNGSYFLCNKYDVNGNMLWSKSTDTSYVATYITLEAGGSIYIAGYFTGSHFVKGGSGSKDFFVVKYDTNGNLLSNNGFAATDDSKGVSLVAMDMSGNIYVAGQVNGNMFIAKYTSFGNIIWLDSTLGSANANSVIVDGSGNVYVAGSFGNTAIFGNITLTNTNYSNETIFLVKYDVNGNVIWANNDAGGSGGDYYIQGGYATIDAFGNIYITGMYCSIYNVGVGNTTFYGGYLFLNKYNSNGTIIWSVNATINTLIFPLSLNIDVSGNVYVGGYFYGSIVFGNFGLNNPSIDNSRLFLAKLSGNTISNNYINTDGNNIGIYPNPTVGLFTIVLPEPNAEVTITDAIGREIYHTNTSAEKINIELYHTGLYFVRVQTNGQSITRKLVVVK